MSALPQVLQGDHRVRLEVIGDGELRSETEKLARISGWSGHVEFRGVQSPEAVAQAMHAADVLVVPSRRSEAGEEEGSPVAPKEALATGMPVVATNVGGFRTSFRRSTAQSWSRRMTRRRSRPKSCASSPTAAPGASGPASARLDRAGV